jgi:hypothetical protein
MQSRSLAYRARVLEIKVSTGEFNVPINWKLSPSDFAFLWRECKRCFYLKIVRKYGRPRTPMPAIFNKIDQLMKDYFEEKNTADISPDLPPGNVIFGGKWVESLPIVVPNRMSTCYIRGIFDTVVRFEDDSYGVVDFKTSKASPKSIPLYSRQLNAYAYALENPAPGKLGLAPVSKLGLLCVEPMRMTLGDDGMLAYESQPVWLECPRNDDGFLSFIGEVLDVLDSPVPPESGIECQFCKYRDDARDTAL